MTENNNNNNSEKGVKTSTKGELLSGGAGLSSSISATMPTVSSNNQNQQLEDMLSDSGLLNGNVSFPIRHGAVFCQLEYRPHNEPPNIFPSISPQSSSVSVGKFVIAPRDASLKEFISLCFACLQAPMEDLDLAKAYIHFHGWQQPVPLQFMCEDLARTSVSHLLDISSRVIFLLRVHIDPQSLPSAESILHFLRQCSASTSSAQLYPSLKNMKFPLPETVVQHLLQTGATGASVQVSLFHRRQYLQWIKALSTQATSGSLQTFLQTLNSPLAAPVAPAVPTPEPIISSMSSSASNWNQMAILFNAMNSRPNATQSIGPSFPAVAGLGAKGNMSSLAEVAKFVVDRLRETDPSHQKEVHPHQHPPQTTLSVEPRMAPRNLQAQTQLTPTVPAVKPPLALIPTPVTKVAGVGICGLSKPSPLLGVKMRVRRRTSFDPATELPYLLQRYAENSHPDREMVQTFVDHLNQSPFRKTNRKLDLQNVICWFKNHRACAKKKHSDSTEASGRHHSGNVNNSMEEEASSTNFSVYEDQEHDQEEDGDEQYDDDPEEELDVLCREDDEDHFSGTLSKRLKLSPSHETNGQDVTEPRGMLKCEADEWNDSWTENRVTPPTTLSKTEVKEETEESVSVASVTVAASVHPSSTGLPSNQLLYNISRHLSSYSHQLNTVGCAASGQETLPQVRDADTVSKGICKIRRSRCFIDPATEISRLEAWFQMCQHPHLEDMQRFCQELNNGLFRRDQVKLKVKNIQLWFKNRRAKERKIFPSRPLVLQHPSQLPPFVSFRGRVDIGAPVMHHPSASSSFGTMVNEDDDEDDEDDEHQESGADVSADENSAAMSATSFSPQAPSSTCSSSCLPPASSTSAALQSSS